MALSGIPISEDQCIGDSLQTINLAFSALDVITSMINLGVGLPTLNPSLSTAHLGSIYLNLSGGTNQTLWVKELSGASGWVAK